MATNQSPTVGAASADSQREQTINESNSPILPSDSEFDSNQEQQPPTRSPTPSPPPPGLGAASAQATATIAPSFLAADAQATAQLPHPTNRTLHVPAALRRNTSTFVPFSEIPSLPAFLNNCNLSQYLQSFNEAGASDDAMPLIIDFDDDELKSIMDAIPMKPFHAVTFRKGIRDLRERNPATRELIMHQALIYGKHSSRSLTKYEHAINCAAQNLALEDSSLLTNKGLLWNKAKAKLLEEDYHYKRGKSRSKLPEAAVKKDHKASKERLIQKREANASNAATARLRRIASLGEQLHRKTAEREALLAQLLRLEAAEYKIAHADTYEAEAKELRENLARVETDRQSVSKELGSLKNKERKHQWYEKRKKVRTDGDPSEVDEKAPNAGTDAEADEEAETDTTVDPEGDASQKSLTGKPAVATAAGTPSGTKNEPKPLTWKAHQPTLASLGLDGSKATSTRSKKRKDIFRPSEYTPGVQG
ncbi:MAG: hypothetical protein JOS17DRAFT_691423 [Linnemannia elongata]|nr:MAG: hypothetical protein JOS17DRAFT_691423 [Linnemannia elongata]